MSDLLFEIGTEEMPALEAPRLAEELKAAAIKAFSTAHLSYAQLKVAYTPRRLALLVSKLASQQADRIKEIKGPPAAVAFDQHGSPTQTGIAFAESHGFSGGDLEKREVGDKAYAYARQTLPGRPTVEVLPVILPSLVEGLHPAKRMRWDASGLAFIRPIRWLVCLYEDVVIPISLGSLVASCITRGHRFIARQAIPMQRATEYEAALAEALVIVDPEKRKKTVTDGLREAANGLGGEALLDDELLLQIVNGAEHPTAVVGAIPVEFLDLPNEVIGATLREEGKFVPLHVAGKAYSHFVGFRDGLPDDRGIVRSGFERVVRARLRDSRFFFDKDRQRPLSERVRELRDVIYDVRLGSMWEKAERIRALAGEIAARSGTEGASDIDRAAFLCKADLVTEMVKAFPKLQGIIGEIYAQLDGEPNAVCTAIREHRLPVLANDELPESDAGIAIALADKLDTVVSALLVGEEPSGSRDPYGIKRQANGLVRIAIEKQVDVDFLALLDELKETYAAIEKRAGWPAVKGFLVDRVSQLLKQRYAIPPDVVACVSASGIGNVYRMVLRARALIAWKTDEVFQTLVAASARVRNILGSAAEGDFDPALFQEEAERTLWREYLKAEGQFTQLAEKGNYKGGVEHLVPLADPINRYFDDVLVMTQEEELRRNRLGFLSALAGLFLHVGDFSELIVEDP